MYILYYIIQCITHITNTYVSGAASVDDCRSLRKKMNIEHVFVEFRVVIAWVKHSHARNAANKKVAIYEFT